MPNTDFDYEGDDDALKEDLRENEVEADDEATDETDEDLYMDDDDEIDMEDVGGGDEAEEEEEVELEAEDKEDETPTVKEEETAEGDPYRKVREDIIKTLPDGEDTRFIVKGKEYRAGDIPAQEWVNVIQKGIRADQIFQEQGELRRTLEQERELVNRGTEQVQRLLDQYGQGGKPGAGKEVLVPEFLKPNELDTEDMKLLKQYAADVTTRVATLESGARNSEIKGYENEVLNEVKTLAKEYPVASIDEVLAVKSQFPKERLEDLMRMSNTYYSSLEFLQKALDANPTASRELKEKMVREYNAKKGKTRNVGVKRSRTSSTKKVSTKATKKPGFNYDFDNAEDGARDYLAEITRLRNV